MGQVKNRGTYEERVRAAIERYEQEKESLPYTQIFAIRHCANGSEEALFFKTKIPSKGFNNRNDLLQNICQDRWDGRFGKIVGYLTEYLIETRSWKQKDMTLHIMGLNVEHSGIEIHFYEKDIDSGYSSCRQTLWMERDKLKARAEKWRGDHSETHDINIYH